MSKKLYISFLCLVVLLLQSVTVLAADRYQWITSTDTVTFSFDTQTIKLKRNYTGQFYLDVWIKENFNDQGVQNEIKDREKSNLPITGYENLSHSMVHYLYSYPDGGKYRIIEGADYSKGGTILDNWRDSTSFQYTSLEGSGYSLDSNVIPGSVGESMGQTLVEYARANEWLLKNRR